MPDISRRRFLTVAGMGAVSGSVVAAGAAGWPPATAGAPAPQPVAAQPTAPRSTAAASGYVTRQGKTLIGPTGAPFRFAGANLYWLGLDENLNPNPSYPSHQAIRQGLSAAVALGCTVVRSFTLGVSVGSPLTLEPELGQFNSDAWDSIDYAVACAQEMGLKLIIPLTNQWRYYYGGKWNFVHWVAGTNGVTDTNPDMSQNSGNNTAEQAAEAQFYTSSTVFSAWQDYVTYRLGHVNAYNGLTASSDPTVLAWETGNELYDATTAWTSQAAALIRSLTSTTLISDGSASSRLATASGPGVNVADIDIVGAHYYPTNTTHLAADTKAARAANKVFVVGEWPSDTPRLSTWLPALERTTSIAGDLVWSIFPYLPDGTAEIHNDNQTVHVPGATAAEVAIGTALFNHATAMGASA